MTFMAPWWLAATAALGSLVVVLHLLARRRPRTYFFPTTRFIPDRPTTAASLAARPADLPLLLYRLFLVLLLGAAFAQPVTSPPSKTTHLVLVDQSRVAPPLDSASLALVRSADAVIAFDSSARLFSREDLNLRPGRGRGSLSVALVAALRAAPQLAATGDSIALTIVSPFALEEFDRATSEIRQKWKGRIALALVEPRRPNLSEDRVALAPDDPIAATIALLEPDGMLSSRLVRGRALSSDTAFARAGNALVIWPSRLEEMGWARRPIDTVGGVAADNQAVVAAFPREFVPPAGALAAVWSDGAAAATVIPLGEGCIRNVAIPLPAAGDLVLRESFLRLSRSLLASCSGSSDATSAPEVWLDSLRGSERLFPSKTVGGSVERKTPAHPWLLLSAALVFALEPLVRRRRLSR